MITRLSCDAFVAREQSDAADPFQSFFQARSGALARFRLFIQSLELREQHRGLEFGHPIVVPERGLAFSLFAGWASAIREADDLVRKVDVAGDDGAAFARG